MTEQEKELHTCQRCGATLDKPPEYMLGELHVCSVCKDAPMYVIADGSYLDDGDDAMILGYAYESLMDGWIFTTLLDAAAKFPSRLLAQQAMNKHFPNRKGLAIESVTGLPEIAGHRPEQTPAPTLDDLQILVIGDQCWGKGTTLKEAIQKAKECGKRRTLRYYIAYIAAPGTWVDDMGSICTKAGTPRPREFHRLMPREAAKK